MLKFASPPVVYVASALFCFAVAIMDHLSALIIQRECSPAAFGMLSGLTLAIIQTDFQARHSFHSFAYSRE
jgi:hypothetical protein